MATIITRQEGVTAKGAELSYTELDNNFINLNTDKYESGDDADFGDVTANNFNTTSDYRLKNNITEITYTVTEKIDELRVVSFNYKNNPGDTEVGFIAHEVQQVFPTLVSGEKDGEEIQTINMVKLIPYLVKSLQECKARIDELENR